MAKVYAVWFDNCEAYEDNHTDVVSIHATHEGAVRKIESIIEDARNDNSLADLDKLVNPISDEVTWNLTIKIGDDDDWLYEEAYSIREYGLEE